MRGYLKEELKKGPPLTILEAMSSGACIMATEVGAYRKSSNMKGKEF